MFKPINHATAECEQSQLAILCVSQVRSLYGYVQCISFPLTFNFTFKAATDAGNNMLTHHHHGVYGLINRGRWSCCANPRRACSGCSPVTFTKASEGMVIFNFGMCVSVILLICLYGVGYGLQVVSQFT